MKLKAKDEIVFFSSFHMPNVELTEIIYLHYIIKNTKEIESD